MIDARMHGMWWCNYWNVLSKTSSGFIDNDNQLQIISYNSTGSNANKFSYLNDASYSHDITST